MHGLRINNRNSILRRKPQFAVFRFDTGWPHAAIALHIKHAVGFSICHGRDRRALSVSKRIQILLAYSIDAAVTTHPEVASLVFKDLEYAIIKEAVAFGITRKFSIFKTPESSIVSSNPDHAIAVLIDCSDIVAGQTITLTPVRE